jgi:hypothetical protein
MAAPLGYKDFTTGEILTANDVDGYLMQGIWVFASAAARDAAVTSPQEGNFAYLKDTNVTTYYTGSAWTNLDTTGMVNPMTTTGDTIYSSSGSTPARLGIGSTGQVLTVAGGVPTWATAAAGGGKVLQVVMGTLTGLTNTTSGSLVDSGLSVSITPSLATSKVLIITGMGSIAKNAGNAANGVKLALLRGATVIMEAGDRNAYNNTSIYVNVGSVSLNYLDSPATTSATTYKVQFGSIISGQSSAINDYNTSNTTTSTILALEIGA